MISRKDQGVRLVCFDIGGVVIRTCRSWAEACAAAGIEVRDAGLWEKHAARRRSLMDLYHRGRIGGYTYAQRVSDLLEGLYSPAEIMGVINAWLQSQQEGFAELIGRVHAAGLDTAALSNAVHEHWVRMPEFPAVMLIRHHLPSHRLGVTKPSELIYRRLEQQLGYAGAEILFFDDLPENVQGARRVGWLAEQVDPKRPTAGQIAEALSAHGL